jgi:hypothetical protein
MMLTTAFETAAQLRAKTLGLEGHPLVVIPHPLATCSQAEVKTIAANVVDGVARGLTRSA